MSKKRKKKDSKKGGKSKKEDEVPETEKYDEDDINLKLAVVENCLMQGDVILRLFSLKLNIIFIIFKLY